jgi:hypothetical protein
MKLEEIYDIVMFYSIYFCMSLQNWTEIIMAGIFCFMHGIRNFMAVAQVRT